MFTLSVAAGFLFQSTPPVKAATLSKSLWNRVRQISIHAAREGGDWKRDFWGEFPSEFQSTPPVKAATKAPLRRRRTGRDFNPRRP